MYTIIHRQTVATSLPKCWKFFSNPSNLKLLTPSYLGFSEASNSEPMYEGQVIIHYLKPLLGIPMEWVTEITHIKPFEYFIDEQRFGPYKFWHHEHRFLEVSQGTEIIDSIYYKLPFGILGKAIHYFKVRKDLDAIFSYRQKKIAELF